MHNKLSTAAFSLCSLFLTAQLAHAQVPEYQYDPNWPQTPLPNNWWMQGIYGLAVDHEGLIWVLSQPAQITPTQNYAQRNPPAAACCVAAPSVVVFDADGNVVDSWNSAARLPSLHGMDVDDKGNVWIGSSTVYRFTRSGQMVGSIPHVNETNAPAGGFAPGTETVVGRIEDVKIDEDANEVYLVDTYLNGRVMVFDADTLQFKRGWGAYGKPLSEISMYAGDLSYDPEGPPAQEFLGHVTVGLSDDGMVYAADRGSDRIQVFTKAGEYQKEFFLAPETLAYGSTGGVAFSEDAEQRYLLIPDVVNAAVWVLEREDGEVMGRLGSAGPYPGQFETLHMLDVDADGNLYTGEVGNGKRVQRFLRVN